MTLLRSAGLFLMLLAAPRSAWPQTPAAHPYRDPHRLVSDRVRDLLARMTLQEKFWQLYMVPGDLDDPAHDYSHGSFGLQIAPARATRRSSRAWPAPSLAKPAAAAYARCYRR